MSTLGSGGLGGLSAMERQLMESTRRIEEQARARQYHRATNPPIMYHYGNNEETRMAVQDAWATAAAGTSWTSVGETLNMDMGEAVARPMNYDTPDEQVGDLEIVDMGEFVRIRRPGVDFVLIKHSELIEIIEALCRVEDKLTKAGKIS